MTRSFKDQYLKSVNPGGVIPPDDEQATPSGLVQQYVGAVAPAGYLICDGTVYDSITNTEYAPLYAKIQNRFGGSDGSDFQVPDMRGMVARGAGVNGSHQNAVNNYYDGGNIGEYDQDQFHTHYHADNIVMSLGANAGFPTVVNHALQTSTTPVLITGGWVDEGQPTVSGSVTYPTPLSGYGTNRPGDETKPATISLSYIIKV